MNDDWAKEQTVEHVMKNKDIITNSEINIKKKKSKINIKIIDIISYLALAAMIILLAMGLYKGIKSLSVLSKYISYFVTGVKFTLGLSFISVLIGTVIGTGICFAKMSNNIALKALAVGYVEIIRGTPLITQLFIVFFGSAILFNTKEWGLPISTLAFIAGVVAVSLNSGGYVAEVIRSGIQSVDKGQMEAGRSLGMSKKQTMKEIIIPQATKNILPALANEFITVIKETSIVSVIGVTDIMYNVNIVRGTSFRSMEPLFMAAILYFVLTFTLSKLVNKFEGKLKESD